MSAASLSNAPNRRNQSRRRLTAWASGINAATPVPLTNSAPPDHTRNYAAKGCQYRLLLGSACVLQNCAEYFFPELGFTVSSWEGSPCQNQLPFEGGRVCSASSRSSLLPSHCSLFFRLTTPLQSALRRRFSLGQQQALPRLTRRFAPGTPHCR